MKIVNSPSRIPAGVPYFIYKDDNRSRHLARILAVCLDGGTFKGYCEDAATAETLLGPGEILVVIDPAWRRDFATAPAALSDRLVIMAIAEEYVWSYWAFMSHCLDDIRREPKTAEPVLDALALLRAFSRHRRGRWDVLEDNGRVTLCVLNNLFFYEDKNFWEENQPWVTHIHHTLSDQSSRDLWLTLLFGTSRELYERWVNRMFADVQYMDYIRLGEGDVIINGGINEGTEIPFFLNAVGSGGVIHNIDPLGDGYCTEYVTESIKHSGTKVVCHSLALADYTGEITLPVHADPVTPETRMQAIGGIAGGDGGTSSTFPCMTIDDFVAKQNIDKVSLIKMDLEGGETRAINGMAETIRRFRPSLAISIYHSREDMLHIPGMLMELCDNYSFHLNMYSYERWEVILYAIPRSGPPSNRLGLGIR